MKTKWLGWLSLITLTLTTLWLILMIWDLSSAGPLDNFEQVLGHVGKKNSMLTATYLNAGLLTIAATAFMGGLYFYAEPISPEWSIVGFIFVPIYGTLNLIAYFSQITLVPALLEAAADPVMADTAFLLLQQTLQLLPGSTIGFFNALAYALLGIPSIIFGLALTNGMKRPLQISGWLLLLNGIACILGVIGFTLHSDPLSLGTVLGGVLFWLALFPMTYGFFRSKDA